MGNSVITRAKLKNKKILVEQKRQEQSIKEEQINKLKNELAVVQKEYVFKVAKILAEIYDLRKSIFRKYSVTDLYEEVKDIFEKYDHVLKFLRLSYATPTTKELVRTGKLKAGLVMDVLKQSVPLCMNNSLQDQFFGIIIKKRILEWKKVYKILKGINEKARSSINLSPYRTNITDKQKSKIKELQMDLEETEIESASVFTDYDDVMVALNRIALLLEHNHKKFTTNQRNNINIRLNKLLELYK